MGVDGVPIMNGSGVQGGEDYQRWMETRAAHEKPAHRHGGETFSNTLPVRKMVPVKPKNTLGKLRNDNANSNSQIMTSGRFQCCLFNTQHLYMTE